ncbi:hypothetical protein F5Y19DRAFT_143987 [Xylariaceae sp. FL1651]|nr:hypothetical protein F5Y19DRAFT_143987 [Xylariaceae sp. FL1651]
MGFLSFLSKRSHSDLTRRESLKTSAYDETVASSPPIHGKYPFAGNGHKVLEQFQKSYTNLTTIPHYNTPTPPPLVPRIHNGSLHNSGFERPSTAPSNSLDRTKATLSMRSQPKSELPGASQKKYGPYRLPPKVSTDIRAASVSSKPVPSPGLASTCTSSIRSGESRKPKSYVDLLDAQSMIKPADFYGRVQAAGARNYGEDVADRNLEDNRSNFNTEKAQELNAKNISASRRSLVYKHVDDDSEDESSRYPRNRRSVGSGLRSKYANHASDAFPKRTSSRLPPHNADGLPKTMSRTASARSERAARRKSMPSYMTVTSSETPQSSSTGRRGKGKDPDNFPDALRDRARAAVAHDHEYVKPNTCNKRQSLMYLNLENQSRHRRNDSEQTIPERSRSTKDHSRRKTISYSTSTTETRSLAKRQSLQAMGMGNNGEVHKDAYQQGTSIQDSQFSRERTSSRRQLGSTTDLHDSLYDSPAQQPDHKSEMILSPARGSDKKGELNHGRKRSIISLSNKSIMAHDIETSIPVRTSSLRHWSLTSETAMSTLSSNPFRPQSGHTTTTSIDLTPTSPFAKSNNSIPPVPDIRMAWPAQSPSFEVRGVASPACSATTFHIFQPSSEFILDDEISSNGSERTPSPPRGSFEKDLLFSDAGFAGSQLPGLPGLFDTAKPPPSADSLTCRAFPHEYKSKVSNFQMPIYVYSDSEDSFVGQSQMDSSDEDINLDIPKSRPGSSLRYDHGGHEQFPASEELIKEE